MSDLTDLVDQLYSLAVGGHLPYDEANALHTKLGELAGKVATLVGDSRNHELPQQIQHIADELHDETRHKFALIAQEIEAAANDLLHN